MVDVAQHHRSRTPFARLLDLVWPPKCAGCERRRTPGSLAAHPVFCRLCRPTVESLPDGCCLTCADPAGAPERRGAAKCLRCLQYPPPQTRARAAWIYRGAVSDAVQGAKYAGQTWRLERLAIGFGRWLQSTRRRPVSAVAVPAHPKDVRRSGYHVADLLLRLTVKDNGGLRPAWDVLSKSRRTVPQASLPLEKRRANVRGVFTADPSRVDGKDWLLVDDVITTGSTVTAAASALVKAGARSVEVAALARAGRPG